jgi:anti-sigma B factor antagonist
VDETEPFAISVAPGPAGQTVITVTGELDLASSERLRGQVASIEPGASVVLDLTAVGFCDSSGLRALLDADLQTRAGGGKVRLAAPGAALLRLFELTGVDGFLSVFPTLEEALAE